jgi:hypothetical protein
MQQSQAHRPLSFLRSLVTLDSLAYILQAFFRQFKAKSFGHSPSISQLGSLVFSF